MMSYKIRNEKAGMSTYCTHMCERFFYDNDVIFLFIVLKINKINRKQL